MTVSIDNVHFSYGDTVILDGICAEFKAGTFSVILGANGSGKTTLFNCISRFLPIQQGDILIAGKSIRDYRDKEFAQNLSVLTQSMQCPEFMSVHDMVMQGRFCYQSFLSRYSDHDLAIVEKTMKAMEVEHLAAKRVATLSGGQLQRCRMAMLLSQETDIVMLDEPTTHLDLQHQYSLLDMGKALAQQGKTVVAVLHDMMQASLYADMVMILHDAKVYASGKPYEVITAKTIENLFHISVKNIGQEKIGVYVPEYLI